MSGLDAETFEELATMVGIHAAGEVLMLAVARACGDNAGLWSQALSLGIPSQQQEWPTLSTLQKNYDNVFGTLEKDKTGGEQDNAEFRETCGGEAGANSAKVRKSVRSQRRKLGTAPAPKKRVADRAERDRLARSPDEPDVR